MKHQNWKIIGLATGAMRVDSDTKVQIFIQHGIANVYCMAELKDEVDVSKLNFAELNNWIDKTINKI